MEEWEELRTQLVQFMKHKFYSRAQITLLADDIVNEAITNVLPDKNKCNFAYLSKVCIHIAYRQFKKIDIDEKSLINIDNILGFVNEDDIIDEIIESEDTAEILTSLEILKQIERIIVLQRYYGDFSFAEIAQKNGMKLNTVLSHHRRALEKLRPHLSKFVDDRVKQEINTRQRKNGNFSKLF